MVGFTANGTSCGRIHARDHFSCVPVKLFQGWGWFGATTVEGQRELGTQRRCGVVLRAREGEGGLVPSSAPRLDKNSLLNETSVRPLLALLSTQP